MLGAYGVEPDLAFVRTAINRMRQFFDHLSTLAAAGSEWGVQLARRGLLGELEVEIGWVERHAAELAGS